MPTYYVGPGGNDGNTGLSWGQRKLTLNGAEDTPVVAGDTVYVAPGVYRETLTVDVSGAAGSPITYIGDYTGANTDGVGGVVRITGSDDDMSPTRSRCIYDNNVAKYYRTFRGFMVDSSTSAMVYLRASDTDWIIEQCFIQMYANSTGIYVTGLGQRRVTIRNCVIFSSNNSISNGISFVHSADVSNAGHSVENCIILGGGGGISTYNVGGVSVKNCVAMFCTYGVAIRDALAAGQTFDVTNCLVSYCADALYATVADGTFLENYNNLFCNVNARTNVNIGANSVSYPALLDSRWFFEAVNGGRMVTPFDLGQWSKLIDLAGLNPPATDLRGTGQIGAARERGPLEYDTTLRIAGSGGAPRIVSISGELRIS